MANILKSKSARIALRSITQSLAAASTTTTYGLSSVRFLHSCQVRDHEITPPFNWGVVTLPSFTVSVIERYGKYVKTLPSGIHYLVPFVDRIAYSYLIREHFIDIPAQLATSKDNVSVLIEGLLRVQVVDPILASYEVETTLSDDLIQLAQTTIRSEFSKIILHDYFDKGVTLDEKILESITVTVKSWGVKCSKYTSIRLRDASPDSED